MEISFRKKTTRKLKQIKGKQPALYKKIQKQLRLFKLNPKHPSLRTHKLKGNLANTWSISIEDDVRMIYSVENHEAIFIDLGTHDEVYKK